jgi:hypothetical protein
MPVPPLLALGLVFSAWARPTDGDGLHPYEAEDRVVYQDSPHGLVRVHYSEEGPNLAMLADEDGDARPDFPTLVGERSEEALELYTELGFRLPVAESALGLEALGGSDALDVYLVDFAGVADGMFAVDRCREGHCAGHLLIENDFAGYGYSSLEEAVSVLTSHELFHGVQYAYLDDEPSWMAEGTAVWAEYEFRPGVEDFLWFCNAYLDDLGRPFDSPPTGVITAASYGTALVFSFTELWAGPGVVKGMHERLESMGGDLALDALLEEMDVRGAPLDDLWPTFAAWSLATGRRAGEIDSFPFAADLTGISPTVSGDVGGELPILEVDERVYPFAAIYVRLEHAGGNLVLQPAEDATGLVVELHPVVGDRADGPVGASFGQVTLSGQESVDWGELPQGPYWLTLSQAIVGGDSLRPTLCLGGPEAVAACAPVEEPGGDGESGDSAEPSDTGSGADASVKSPEETASGGCAHLRVAGVGGVVFPLVLLFLRRRRS